MNIRFMSGFALTLAATLTFLTPATSAQAEALTLTDIAGRQVTLDERPEKNILGEGRMMYAITAITFGFNAADRVDVISVIGRNHNHNISLGNFSASNVRSVTVVDAGCGNDTIAFGIFAGWKGDTVVVRGGAGADTIAFG